MRKTVMLILILVLSLTCIVSYFPIVYPTVDSATFQVNNSYDDAYQTHSTGALYMIYSYLLVEGSDTNDRSCGIVLDNVNIPHGANIISVNISFWKAVEAQDDVDCNIYGHDVDNSYVFADSAGSRVIDRETTTEYVAWAEDSLWTGEASWIKKTGLEDVVQEIIDRPGWSSGNSLCLLLIRNSGIKELKVRAYEYGSSYAPKIDVSWEVNYITFYFNVGGEFRVNNITVTNGSVLLVPNGTILELCAVVLNRSYIFLSFNWTEDGSITNPYDYTVTGNMTVWCYFDTAGVGELYIISRFTWNISNPSAEQTVLFNGSTSESSSTITDYSWDWGDETETGTGETTMHSYAENDTYVVTLTVTSTDGSDAFSIDITVGGGGGGVNEPYSYMGYLLIFGLVLIIGVPLLLFLFRKKR